MSSLRNFFQRNRAAFGVPPFLASGGVACSGRQPALAETGKPRLYCTNSEPPKKIALLGATGGTGRHVLLQALDRGYHVTALARDPSKLQALVEAHKKQQSKGNNDTTDSTESNHNQLRIVQGDALNLASVEETVKDADVVISCIGARTRDDTIMTSVVKNLDQVMGVKEQKKNDDDVDSAVVDGVTGTVSQQLSQTEANKSPKQKLVMMTTLGCGGTSPVIKYSLAAFVGFGAMKDMDKADTMIREKFATGAGELSGGAVARSFTIVRPPRIDESRIEETTVPALAKKYFATTDYPKLCPIACGMSQTAVAEFIVDCVETEEWNGKAVQIYAA